MLSTLMGQRPAASPPGTDHDCLLRAQNDEVHTNKHKLRLLYCAVRSHGYEGRLVTCSFHWNTYWQSGRHSEGVTAQWEFQRGDPVNSDKELHQEHGDEQKSPPIVQFVCCFSFLFPANFQDKRPHAPSFLPFVFVINTRGGD
ncbi:uncharacterized [Tachysurus ichikawai]